MSFETCIHWLATATIKMWNVSVFSKAALFPFAGILPTTSVRGNFCWALASTDLISLL